MADRQSNFTESVIFNVAVPGIEELTTTPRDDSLQLDVISLSDRHRERQIRIATETTEYSNMTAMK